jgi:hypothetical protein
MSADKPLQDVFNTVRIPVTDAIVYTDAPSEDNANGVITFSGYGTTQGLFWNCYPNFYTDRSQNQYSSQFDTWAIKRSACASRIGGPSNATIPTANTTNPAVNMVVTSLDDVFVAAVWDNTATLWRIVQYRPSAGTSVQIGTIAGGALTDSIYLYEAIVANVPTLLVSYQNTAETASVGAFATSAGGVFTAASLTVIADVDFPGNIAGVHTRGNFVQMDGYAFIMSKEGGVYNSDLNSITSWNALGVVQANSSPDQGVGLVKYKSYIMAFGEDSIQFFTDVANSAPKSPLGRTDQAFFNWGCPFAKSILQMDDTVYWWSKSSGGRWGLWKLDGGFSPVKMSSYKEEAWAVRIPKPPELYMLSDNQKQHIITTIQVAPMLLSAAAIAIPGVAAPVGQPAPAGFTSDPFSLAAIDVNVGFLCYDLSTGNPWIYSNATYQGLGFPLCAMNFQNSLTYNGVASVMTLVSSQSPRTVAGAAGTANQLFEIVSNYSGGNANFFVDGGLSGTFSYITAGIQFNSWDFGNDKQKRISRFSIIHRQSQQSVGQPTLYPWTWVVYTKYKGVITSDGVSSSINRIYKRPCVQNPIVTRTYINNLGTARNWTFGIVQKSDGPFFCKAIELNITQGTN